MDEAEFDRLVTYEKKRQKSLAEVYEKLDPERQQLPYLRNRIAESRSAALKGDRSATWSAPLWA